MTGLGNRVQASVASCLAAQPQLSAPAKALPAVPLPEALTALACPSEEVLLKKYAAERAWRKGKVRQQQLLAHRYICIGLYILQGYAYIMQPAVYSTSLLPASLWYKRTYKVAQHICLDNLLSMPSHPFPPMQPTPSQSVSEAQPDTPDSAMTMDNDVAAALDCSSGTGMVTQGSATLISMQAPSANSGVVSHAVPMSRKPSMSLLDPLPNTAPNTAPTSPRAYVASVGAAVPTGSTGGGLRSRIPSIAASPLESASVASVRTRSAAVDTSCAMDQS